MTTMKIKNILVGTMTAVAVIASLSSCTSYLDVNDNPNYPTDASLSTLMPSVCATTFAQYGLQCTLLGNLWTQFVTQGNTTNQYNTYANYTVLNTDAPSTSVWRNAYSNTLPDLKTMISMAEEQKAWNYWLIGKVLTAYNYLMLTDLYGDIPFTQAINSDEYPNPEFDDSKTVVYPGIIKMLDEAIAKQAEAKSSMTSLSNADLYCNGDVDKWVAFARSLKLKMYLRDFSSYKSEIQSLLSAGGLLEEDFKVDCFEDATNKGNPLYEFNIRQLNTPENLRACHTMLEYFLANGDHRCEALYDKIGDKSSSTGLSDSILYEGLPCGTKPETSIIELSSSSRMTQSYSDPVYLMNGAEAEFLISEAYARLDDMADAKTYYDKGVTAAFSRYGMAANGAELLAGNYAFDADNALKCIMMQKWLSYAGANTMDGWFDRCRTGIPEITTGVTVRESDAYNKRALTSGYVLGTLVDPGSSNMAQGVTLRRLPLPTYSVLYNTNASKYSKSIDEPLWWQVGQKK
jgi:hypothetical protein